MTRAQTIAMTVATMLILLVAESTASAQGHCYQPVFGPAGWDSPGWAGWGSTYNGSCSGAHVPSYGSYVPSCGMGLVHQQIAARLALENSLRAVEVYFQRRLLNEQYRRELRQVKVARIRERFETRREISSMKDEFADVIEINQQQAEELARRCVPKRLTAAECNELTGSISWPPLFQQYPRFAEDRVRIDTLFAERTRYNCGALSRNCVEVGKAVERMKLTLRSMQDELDGTTYMAAKHFLSSLAYEARFPVQPTPAQVAAK
jgi:hypothetical protein